MFYFWTPSFLLDGLPCRRCIVGSCFGHGIKPSSFARGVVSGIRLGAFRSNWGGNPLADWDLDPTAELSEGKSNNLRRFCQLSWAGINLGMGTAAELML